MGMYAVDFEFDCTDDSGTDLRGSDLQEMDAFIVYGGPGEWPPSVIRIGRDSIARVASTGEVYDPEAYGHEDSTAWPAGRLADGTYYTVEIVIYGGKVMRLARCDE